MPSRTLDHLWGVVAAEHSQRIVALAVRERLLTAAQAAQIEARKPTGEPLVPADLIAAGWLQAADLARLEDEISRQDFERPSPSSPPQPPEVRVAEENPARVLPGFVLVERLARGGAGEVWRAWDKTAGRWVAIKQPAGTMDSATAKERFHREALAIARLDHPNILPLYQIGESDGRPFLVMPLVDGKTLAEGKLPLPRVIELMRQVALAIDYAHKQGLVHRDVKPANLMIDQRGRVFVMDFGLVYLLADRPGTDVTAPGQAMGTAAYMSPEQARGSPKAREPATDIYSLGATLYELATGRPPFAAESFASLVVRVVTDDPLPLRSIDPTLPRDLEIVVQKAMAKDPANRYATAGDLAEDLRRMGAGEPITARPISFVARIVRRARRRGETPLAIAAIGIVIAAATYQVTQRAARRAAVSAIRETSRLSLDTALKLRRAGDLAGMRDILPRFEASYRSARDRAPQLAEVEYLMGRFYRAVMDDAKALEHQNAALSKDASYLPARYERAILLSRTYGVGASAALPGSVKAFAYWLSPGAPQPPDAHPDLGDQRRIVLDDLRALATSATAATDLAAAAGILAFHENRHADARGLLREVVAKDPLREEAWEHLAAVAATLRDFDEAERVYAEGLARDRGYVPYYLARCRTRNESGRYSDAIADAETALNLDPGRPEARLCRGAALALTANLDVLGGRDPRLSVEAAIKDADEALSRTPGLTEPRMIKAMALRSRAMFSLRAGADPTSDLERALALLGAIATDEPRNLRGLAIRGRLHFLRGLFLLSRRQDPSQAFADSRADLDLLIERFPDYFEGWQFRGALFAHRGLAATMAGRDADAAFAQAEADLSRALQLRESGWTLLYRATARTWHARTLTGGDAATARDRAREDLERASRLIGHASDPWILRATVDLDAAASAAKAARAALLRQADRDLSRAAKLDPRRAEVWLQRSRWHAFKNSAHAAAAARQRALALNPYVIGESETSPAAPPRAPPGRPRTHARSR